MSFPFRHRREVTVDTVRPDPTIEARRILAPDLEHVTALWLRGAQQAADYFHVDPDEAQWPSFRIVARTHRPGYSTDLATFNLPITWLNQIAAVRESVGWDAMVAIAGMAWGEVRMPFDTFLVATGREEMIHHMQHRGMTPHLVARPLDIVGASDTERLLSAVEVEARRAVDAIAAARGEPALWRAFDRQLAARYPADYGRKRPDVTGSGLLLLDL